MKPIIRVQNLSKQYRIGARQAAYGTLRDSIAGALRNPFRRNGSEENTIWALKDVSFDVMPGEVVGIIGRNGAGKSTLLKILSRITEPTTGEIDIYGRVGALLEVGTGFHMELTGRENIYLNGAILGMSHTQIRRRFDEIIDFAGIEKFLDTPVKHYSSGMFMRLAFSVAAHLEPEILAIDEILAVGDSEFQKKCLGKIGEVAKQGRTVLFVSHNMQAVSTFCTQGIYLLNGAVAAKGQINDVVSCYLGDVENLGESIWTGDEGCEEFRLKQARIIGDKDGIFTTDSELRIQIQAEVLQPLYGLIFAVELWSSRQQLLAYSAYDDAQAPPPNVVKPGVFNWEVSIPPNSLAAGSYEIRFDFGLHHKKLLVDPQVGILRFTVENIFGIARRFPGNWTHIFRPDWKWHSFDPSAKDELLDTEHFVRIAD
ncbi:MAG: ATP-binding cassette domain-containing protein [Acidobacteriota bacterium]|nr:MAG: ATP-binding cassette domain-containing protein [Acidobacteriota bacterium]